MDNLLKLLSPEELTVLRFRALFEARGYRRYHTARFEEYKFYLENQSFLSSDRVITFNDLDGSLLALRPDVTLGVVRAAAPEKGKKKLYYIENVYRPNSTGRNFREISQMGLECLGEVAAEDLADVTRVAYETLALTGEPFRLALSHVGYLAGLMDALGVRAANRADIYAAVYAKNPHGLREAASKAGLGEADAEALAEAALISGAASDILPRLKALCRSPEMECAAAQLALAVDGLSDGSVLIDFSIRGDEDYYSGLMFCGYIEGRSCVALSGGEYDNMLKKMNKTGGAIGFALYLDEMFGR